MASSTPSHGGHYTSNLGNNKGETVEKQKKVSTQKSEQKLKEGNPNSEGKKPTAAESSNTSSLPKSHPSADPASKSGPGEHNFREKGLRLAPVQE